jgi:hypothetical protein
MSTSQWVAVIYEETIVFPRFMNRAVEGGVGRCSGGDRETIISSCNNLRRDRVVKAWMTTQTRVTQNELLLEQG